jgi:hypothetical protein
VKGEAEQEAKEKKVRAVSIFKPGLLRHRRNARTGEKMFSCGFCCCVPGIEATECALAMKIVAEGHCLGSGGSSGVEVYENEDMLQLTQSKR